MANEPQEKWWAKVPVIGAYTHLVNALAELAEEGGVKLPIRKIAKSVAISAVAIFAAALVLGATTPLGMIVANIIFLTLTFTWKGKSRIDDFFLVILEILFQALAARYLHRQLNLPSLTAALWIASPPICIGGIKFFLHVWRMGARRKV